MQIEYAQAITESFDGQPSHEDIVGNTADGGEVIPPEPTPVNLAETITGTDYGKSINYKVTVQGQEVSNWRVFLNDGKNVYIILDDYLSNILVPTATGLTKGDTTKPYSVWHLSNRDALVSSLTTQSYWSEFANGVGGATATGGPTNEQFVKSWNGNTAVNERKLEVGKDYFGSNNVGPIKDSTGMYVPHTSRVSNCDGYWLASLNSKYNTTVWNVHYSGNVDYASFNNNLLSVRPLVCLTTDVKGIVGETVEIK